VLPDSSHAQHRAINGGGTHERMTHMGGGTHERMTQMVGEHTANEHTYV